MHSPLSLAARLRLVSRPVLCIQALHILERDSDLSDEHVRTRVYGQLPVRLQPEQRPMSTETTALVFGYRYLRSSLPDVVWYGTLDLIRSIGMEPMLDQVLLVNTSDLSQDGRYLRRSRFQLRDVPDRR